MLLLTAPALAQAPTGSIQGTITDPTGAVVPEAKVIITNSETGHVLDLTTSSRGTFNSGPLMPGTYKVRIEATGFQTLETSLGVQVGVVASGNFSMKVGQTKEVVTVEASTVMINTEQVMVQGVLTANQIGNLPLAGRNFLDLAQLEPGIQIQDGGAFDPTKNGFSAISVGGRHGRTTRITLDGIDVSDETVGTTTQNISAGAIQEFQLSQSTMDLATDLTSSGAVNVVTKSGTNIWHGDGFYLFRDKRAGMANFPGGQDNYFQRNQFGGSLGGPILKDRLFFFANGEHNRQPLLVPLSTPPPFTSIPQSYPASFKETVSLGRLDAQIKNYHLFYRFTYNFNGDTRAYGATYQAFVNRNNTPAHGVGLDFTSGNFTHSVRFGYLKFVNHIADAVTGNAGIYNPGAPWGIAMRIGGASTVTRFGPSRLAPQATFQTDKDIKYDGSKVHGSHILRYGASFNRILGGGYAAFYGTAGEARASTSAAAQAFAASGPYAGGAGNPLNYSISAIVLGNGQGFFTELPEFGMPAGGQRATRLGLYFGDSWKIKPNFTLTYGLRYSRDTGRQDSDMAPMTCDQINAANFGGLVPCTGSGNYILDQFGYIQNLGRRVRQPNTNFGPQAGFAWDPRRNGKTVIRAGAGLYFENVVFNTVMFDRPPRLQTGLFFASNGTSCPSGELTTPIGTYTSINGVNIATGVCGQRIGAVGGLVAAMQDLYQSDTVKAGPQANGNFLGNILASSPDATGNGFISPGYRTPRSIQMNVGIQHEIVPGIVVSADFLRNVGEHYSLGVDTNHVGDARYLNKVAALNAISATNAGFGCGAGTTAAAINCAIAAGASIEDYAGNGLDSGNQLYGGTPASLNGATPDTGAAFPGMNALVGQNVMLFPIGRSTYTAFQARLTGNKANPFRYVSQATWNVSWSLSRFNSMSLDQDFTVSALDFANPTRYYGPSAMDRTSQLSFGGTFQVSHGPLLSFASHFSSPLSRTLTPENLARSGEIFKSDFTGDGSFGGGQGGGTAGDILPGQNIGTFMRGVNPGDINKLITNFNNTIAGKALTPAGQALVNAGLFTEQQLLTLGATPDPLPLAPAGQVGLGWAHIFDAKITWPIKIYERLTLEPSVSVFNLFNFANFDGGLSTAGAGILSGILNGTPGSVNGTTVDKVGLPGGRNSTRMGLGTGANAFGSPRALEYGLRLVF